MNKEFNNWLKKQDYICTRMGYWMKYSVSSVDNHQLTQVLWTWEQISAGSKIEQQYEQ
jgi:hypothetical protein